MEILEIEFPKEERSKMRKEGDLLAVSGFLITLVCFREAVL